MAKLYYRDTVSAEIREPGYPPVRGDTYSVEVFFVDKRGNKKPTLFWFWVAQDAKELCALWNERQWGRFKEKRDDFLRQHRARPI